MPLFSYKAKDKKGKIVDDTVQASSRHEAASIIKSSGLQVLTIKNIDTKMGALFGGSVSVSEKAAFCRFVGTMLRAGLTLPEAVDIVREETENNKLRKILSDVAFQTRKGSSLSSVLAKYSSEFDEVFLTMIKAGEKAGTLEKSFDYLAKQLLASHEMIQKIKGAMVYPAVILVAMLANAIVMLTFVLPKISEVFSKLNLKLPTLTRLVMSFGSFVGENTALVLIVTVACLFFAFLIIYIRKTRKILINIVAKLPLIKKLMVQIDVARFSRTLSTLLKSGVPILSALDVSADAISRPALKKQAQGFSKGVAAGESLAEVLLKTKKAFPGVMIQTIRAGEKTGSMEEVLEELADFYESEVDYTIKKLTSLLEPLLMLIIGIAVGVMVVIMIIPIYSIVGGLESGF